MQSATFRESYLQHKIDEEGFLLIDKFLSMQEVDELYALYLSKHTTWKENAGQWNTISDLGLKTGLEISEKLLSILKSKFDLLFHEWSAPVATFMSKYPGNQSICHIHRDYSVLDETKQEYWNIWIPLIDITENNGALFVVPQSHKGFQQLLPFSVEQSNNEQSNLLLKYSHTVFPHAGDMVVYKDKTLHGSHRNLTDKTRPVIHLGIFSSHPQFYYYQLRKSAEQQLAAYSVTSNFFFGGNFDERVNGRTPDFVLPYQNHNYTVAQIQNFAAQFYSKPEIPSS